MSFAPRYFVAIALLFAACASAQVVLESSNFESQVTEDTAWFVEFYAPWCGHCKRLEPTWKQLAEDEEIQGQVNVGKVDATQNQQLAAKYGVRGYPTLLLFKGGSDGATEKYSGKRTVADFKTFLRTQNVFRPSTAKITLRYFDTRGRAEVIRLVLEEAGEEYEQELHTPDEWPEIKRKGIESGLLPFGQVPQLSHGNVDLVQGNAILAFLGRFYHLGPKDEDEQVQFDIVMGGYEDLRKLYGRLVYSSDFDSLREAYVKETLPTWLGYFDTLLKKALTQQHFVSNRLTVADIAIFDALNINLGVAPSCLDRFPTLQNFHHSILLRPRILSYLRSTRRPKFQNGASAFFDNAANPSGFDVAEMDIAKNVKHDEL